MNCLVPQKKVFWSSRADKLPNEKSQNQKFRMVGRCIFFYYLLIKRQGRGDDTGSVGLVETRVFFYALININSDAFS